MKAPETGKEKATVPGNGKAETQGKEEETARCREEKPTVDQSKNVSGGGEDDDGDGSQTKTGYAQSQFVAAGSAGRDLLTTLVASNIEDIIEEEEEEEEEKEKKEQREKRNQGDQCQPKISGDSESDNLVAKLKKQLSIVEESEEEEEEEKEDKKEKEEAGDEESGQMSVVEVMGESKLFTLEPVVLEEEEAEEEAQTEQAAAKKGPTNEAQEEDDKGSNDEASEQGQDTSATGSNEIRVEEGYATRQMDEFFRQTIAQIKEELTKKLENNNEEDEDIGDFSDEDEDDYDEDDDDDEFDEDDIENQRFVLQQQEQEGQRPSGLQSYRANRNKLYQQLLAPSTSVAKEAVSWKQASAKWLVLFGAILNMSIVEGLCYNYLNLLASVRDTFVADLNTNDDEETRRRVAPGPLLAILPTALLVGLFLLLAPLSVFMAKTQGSRIVAVFGSVVSAISLLVCSFQDDIYGFMLTYGVLTGIGCSFIFLPSVISLSKWFLKERLTASSFAVLGSSVGAAFYVLLGDYLVRRFDLHGCLLVMAALQLNCLVGSLLLSEENVPYSLLEFNRNHQRAADLLAERREPFKAKTASLTFLVENEMGESSKETATTTEAVQPAQEPTQPAPVQNQYTREYQSRRANNQKRKSALRRNLLLASAADAANNDNQSAISSSTTSYNNYTLKQYWRKFVQTRQNSNNAKKNLFHLIAEEKKKTKSQSKTSLEDGFVITTSNNLLAPNDEENVIIFNRKTALLDAIRAKEQVGGSSVDQSAKTPATLVSRFKVRIAASFRNLTASLHSSSARLGQTNDDTGTDSPTKFSNVNLNNNNNSSSGKLPVRATVPVGIEAEQKAGGHEQNSAITKEPQQLEFLSVFDGPITDELKAEADEQSTPITTGGGDGMPANLASVFLPMSNLDSDLQTNLISPNEINYSEGNSDEEDADQSTKSPDLNAKKRDRIVVVKTTPTNDPDDEEETPQSYVRNFGKQPAASQPNSILKTSRYFSYRSSLTNSVRGSLMEYTVPEDGLVANDTFDMNNLDSASINFKGRGSGHRGHGQRRLYQRGQSDRAYAKQEGDTDGLFSLTFNPALMNTRRFVSTIEAQGLLSAPVNLEAVEHNLRNSLIKKNSDNYRRSNRAKSVAATAASEPRTSSLFVQYVSHVLGLNLFFNPLLILLNISFFFNIIGFYVLIVYFVEFCHSQPQIRHQDSLYIFFLLILVQGFGRVFSTLLFKCNDSTSRGRIYTYNLTLVFLGISTMCATVLCDTVFSLTMFAIVFGSLYGLNASLRSTFVYDVLSLNWSDDGFFAYACISQAFGILVGLPTASLVYDHFKNYQHMLYLSGACFIAAGLIMMPVQKATAHFASAYKALNRFYFQRK